MIVDESAELEMLVVMSRRAPSDQVEDVLTRLASVGARGRVTPGHRLWARIAAAGHDRRMTEIADDPCPPDIIGANYYAASERVLDCRVEGYGGHEKMAVVGDHLVVDYSGRISESLKLPGVIEKRAGVATARNWNTVLKLAELAGQPAP